MKSNQYVGTVAPGSVHVGRQGSARCVVLSSGNFDPEGLDEFVVYTPQNGGGASCCLTASFEKSFRPVG